jgi:hypothetical protein
MPEVRQKQGVPQVALSQRLVLASQRLLINGMSPNSSTVKNTMTTETTAGCLLNATGKSGTQARSAQNNAILSLQSIWRRRLQSAASTGMHNVAVKITQDGSRVALDRHPPITPAVIINIQTPSKASTPYATQYPFFNATPRSILQWICTVRNLQPPKRQ